jgi:hypothetical protein
VSCQTLPRPFSDYEDELGDLDGGGVACRLRTFLTGRTFEPEQIAVMSAAFTDTGKALSLDADDALMPLVAQHVMGLGQRGVKARAVLYLLTLEEFRPYRQINRRRRAVG